MRIIPLTLLLAALLSGCATSNELPPISEIEPSTAQEGSLANEKLIADTTAGLQSSAGVPANATILKFVIQEPVGKPGSRAWRELWVVDPNTSTRQYIITFREDGLGAADFEIRGM